MIIINPGNGNETKSDIFSWNIFKSVTGRKILNYFNDVCKSKQIFTFEIEDQNCFSFFDDKNYQKH